MSDVLYKVGIQIDGTWLLESLNIISESELEWTVDESFGVASISKSSTHYGTDPALLIDETSEAMHEKIAGLANDIADIGAALAGLSELKKRLAHYLREVSE